MTGEQPASPLDRFRAGHPGWTIRRDAGQDWTAYKAQRVQVVVAATLDELDDKLAKIDGTAADDPRITRARELAAGHSDEPVTLADMRTAFARWKMAATGLLDVLDDRMNRP